MTTLVFVIATMFNFNLDQGTLTKKQYNNLVIHNQIIIIETVDIRDLEIEN